MTTANAWHKGPMTGLDFETTGVSTEDDRIVTASIVRIQPGKPTDSTAWLVNPGIPIPEGAAAIHGITTERAQAQGKDPAGVLLDVVTELEHAFDEGPVVLMNAPFDLTMLDRECRRHGVAGLDNVRPVIDVRVLDKRISYRRGPRKLADLCAHYGVRIDGAHDSTYDALAALRVAWRIAERHPNLQIDLGDLHDQQVIWAEEQMANFAAYRRGKGQPLDDEDGTWPLKPWAGAA